jgi:hypothetical protein
MARFEDQIAQVHIGTFTAADKRINASIRVLFDGIEYVGRLWFADESLNSPPLPDRAAFPGRTREEAIDLARRLTPQELEKRYRRALSEKRRFHGLRRATDEILSKIRYLNQVAISMRAGLLDLEGAAQELELTERQLHDCISKLRDQAGVESEK